MNFTSGDFEAAKKKYEEAIRINPNLAEAHNNLGNAFVKLGEYDKAEKEYKEAIRINPNLAEAYNNLGVLLVANQEIYNETTLEKYDEAEEKFKKAIEINPDFAEPHYNLAVLLRKERRVDEVLNEFNEYKAIVKTKRHVIVDQKINGYLLAQA